MNWSYWLGLPRAFLTVVQRALASFGISRNLVPQAGASVSYDTLLYGAILLLLLSIASRLLRNLRANPGNTPYWTSVAPASTGPAFLPCLNC